MATKRRLAFFLTAGAVVALIAGCTAPQTTSSETSPGLAAGAPAEVGKVDAAVQTNVLLGRDIMKTAYAVIAVDDLASARDAVASLTDQMGGVITSEVVTTGSAPQPVPMPMFAADGVGGDAGSAGGDAVDLTLQVPESGYDGVIRGIRALGQVITLQQTASDVSMQVIDVDARISAARASVARMQKLLDEASNLQDVVLIEQELTTRQANLDSLVAQQTALRSQVAESTVSVRLVPADTAATAGGVSAWWSRVTAMFVSIWSGIGVFLVAISPILVLVALAVWAVAVSRRRRRSRGDE